MAIKMPPVTMEKYPMAIPDYQTCMRPLLSLIQSGETVKLATTIEKVADYFNLTEEQRQELLPSKRQTIIRNRVAWANTYLKKAGLIHSPSRGLIEITALGLKALQDCPDKIDLAYLQQFPTFQEFSQAKPANNNQMKNVPQERTDPVERMETANSEIQLSLAQDLLDKVKSSQWQFFEQLVVDLMLAMGYGGAIAQSGKATQPTGDDGIDGMINEDKLGLDKIYLQAKKWEKSVHRPDIDTFIGALTRKGARKGVFITTSKFSEGARQAVNGLAMSVVLIDGQQLTQLMIDYNIGVSIRQIFHIKDMDLDYFSES